MSSALPHLVPAPHRVVVVGAGFGGLFATRALATIPVEVVLIDRSGHHLFQPLLYQVATGILSPGEVARPLREILRHQDNAEVVVGEVTAVDLGRRTVTATTLAGEVTQSYDSLVVAAGAAYSYFGNDSFETWAPGLKSIDDALEIRARLFEAFEMAEATLDPAVRLRHLTFAVVGGGPTGIEVAGQIRDLATGSLRKDFRHVDPASCRVVLLEAGPTLLPTFGPRLSRRTRENLERRGVDVLVGARVVDVDEDGITYETDGVEHRVEATAKVWAAGVNASPLGGLLAASSGATLARSGQVQLEPDCTLRGHPEVFLVGDLMSTPGTPGVAQLAIQSGRFAADVIAARVEGRRPRTRFRYRDKGSLATISRFQAVARIGPVRLCGVLAWFLWLGVHLVSLNGFRNRVTVTLHWAVTFATGQRSERVATHWQAHHPPDTATAASRMTQARTAARP